MGFTAEICPINSSIAATWGWGLKWISPSDSTYTLLQSRLLPDISLRGSEHHFNAVIELSAQVPGCIVHIEILGLSNPRSYAAAKIQKQKWGNEPNKGHMRKGMKWTSGGWICYEHKNPSIMVYSPSCNSVFLACGLPFLSAIYVLFCMCSKQATLP